MPIVRIRDHAAIHIAASDVATNAVITTATRAAIDIAVTDSAGTCLYSPLHPVN